MKLRIGTRASALARAQTADVARRLEALGHAVETIIISTEGDRVTDRAFTDVGAFGIFVREIEAALLDERVDIAVHSYKDLPSKSPDGLIIAAVPERVDVADVLLTRSDTTNRSGAALPLHDGARVGTSAARRQALLRSLRPDLDIGLLRGNVPTRVRALVEGRFDAIVLASAGLTRLERIEHPEITPLLASVIRTRLDPSVFVPAPAQGAIAVQVRERSSDIVSAVAAIDDARTARQLRAERAALALAEGGCTLPFGATCESFSDNLLRLTVALGASDGTIIRAVVEGTDPTSLAAAAWNEVATGARL